MNGASIAGQLGLPFSLASHFAAEQIDQAIQVYKDAFNPEAPTAQISEPYVMAGINVMVTDTDAEAEKEFTVVQQMFNDIHSGKTRRLQPPVDPSELPGVNQMLQIRAVGAPATAKVQMEAFLDRTGADELIVVTYAYDPAVRDRSLQLLAEVWF